MSLKQLTVFVENTQGSLVNITDTLAQNGVNLRALSIADTKDFGLLRLIVSDNDAAETALKEKDYLLKITEVVGVKIGDQPGKLSKALAVLAEAGVNVEYLYAFMARTEKHAYVVLRPTDNAAAEAALAEEAGAVQASEKTSSTE